MSSQITVTVDGASRSVERGTRIRDVLLDGPRKIRDIVAARIDGKVVDLSLPLEADATVEPIVTDSPEGIDVLRHSTAHLMAMAVQALHPGTEVTIGPVIEDGFFYDFAPKTPFTVDDLPKIEAKIENGLPDDPSSAAAAAAPDKKKDDGKDDGREDGKGG